MTLKDEVRELFRQGMLKVAKAKNVDDANIELSQATEAIMERVRERIKSKIYGIGDGKGGLWEDARARTYNQALRDLLTELGGTDDKR